MARCGIGFFVVVIALTGCASDPQERAPVSESERLDAWFAERWEEMLERSPMMKTRLGIPGNEDEIDDFSLAAVDERLAWRRASVDELRREFDAQALTPQARVSYDLWVAELERSETARSILGNHYLFNQMHSAHVMLPNFLVRHHLVEEASDLDAYVSRIAGISRALDQLRERAERNAARGVRPPRFAHDAVLASVRSLLAGTPFDGEGESPLWTDAMAKIDALVASGEIEPAEAGVYRERVREALIEHFRPAYTRLAEWLEDDRAVASTEAQGVWALPNGRAYYQHTLNLATTTNLTAEEIHALGLSEVERIHREMAAIKKEVGFEGSLQDFFEFVRNDDRFYYPNDDAGREAYLDAARAHLARMDAKLPAWFGLLPKAGLEVKRVEPHREQDGAPQHYFSGKPDGSTPGTFYAHLSDMRAMPIPQIETISYHEGVPGHHLQLSIARALEGVPAFRRQTNYIAYSEGWGLYAERLAKEMGGFEDPYSDFGRLTAELWRAIRLVVDSGLHHLAWSEEEAVRYFLDNSPMAAQQIRAEVRRYLVWPGQATAYKVGMERILELRADAQAALGERFDVRAFHDTVLGGGAMPLTLLERRVDNWIAEVEGSTP